MWILLEILLEILLPVLIELVSEFGFYQAYKTVRNPFRNSKLIEGTGYVVVGGMLGAASVFIFPQSFIGHYDLRILNLIITPILAGLAMMAVGSVRRKKGQEPILLDSFTYGALFAFSLQIVRFLFAS